MTALALFRLQEAAARVARTRASTSGTAGDLADDLLEAVDLILSYHGQVVAHDA